MSAEPATKPENQNVLVRLEEVQNDLGFISEESLKEIARSTGVPLSQVYGVATFYSFLSLKKKGRNLIRICRSEPCHIKHAPDIVAALKTALGIEPGQTTADGRFTLEHTNCIGACDAAPAMLVNNDLHGNLTVGKITEILESYK